MEIFEIPARTMTELLRIECAPGLAEFHAEVQWAAHPAGMRFFHVKHDPVPPCISEAIEAEILMELSEGKQKMTGHATVPDCTAVLEVWSDVPTQVLDAYVTVKYVYGK